MKFRKAWLVVGLILIALVTVFCLGSPAVAKTKKVTVAYFPGWPGTFEFGWAKGWFDNEMGVKVDFREFGSGAEMTTAMASGDISIAYALGTTPFAIAVTQGLPLKMVAISENYSESENLVVRGGSGIATPSDLIGKKIGVPFGTTAHYRLMGILEMSGIAEQDVKVIDLSNPDIMPAFIREDIDGGCAWEPTVSQMIEKGGHILVSSADQIKAGYSTYGIVAVTDEFANEHGDLVTKFLQVVNRSTVTYHKNPKSTYAAIGKMAGITPEKTKDIMSTMGFYDKQTQLSDAWLGTSAEPGQIVHNIKKVSDFLVQQGAMDKSLPDYGKFIDASFMENVK